MWGKRKRLLRRFFTILVCFSLVLVLPCYSEAVYEITESELMMIEENNQIILERLNESEMRLESAEKILELAEKKLEGQETELETLEKQLQIQAESYRKLEREKKALIKWGVPTAVVVAAGCFAGGLILGLRL